MTTRLTNLATPFTFQFDVTAASTPEQLTVKIVDTTIAFVENTPLADTITDSGNGFLVAGFQPGDQITVSGSGSNDGLYTIKTVTAGILTLLDRNDLTDEVASATVKITAAKTVPDGVAVTVKAKYANTGVIHLGYSSATALNTAGGSFSLRSNESISIQVENIQDIWIDVSVSGEGVEVTYEKSVQA